MEKRYARIEKSHFLEFPSQYLGQLHENTANDSLEQLLNNLENNGYIFIRGAIDRQRVLAAKRVVLDHMQQMERDQKIFEDQTQGILDIHCGRHCIPRMEGKNEATHHETVLKVLEGNELFSVFERLFGCPAKSFTFKWLRAMYMQGYTGAHLDNVYMSKGSKRTLTCWIPFDDIPVEVGGLVMCEGSSRLSSFDSLRSTYGSIDLDDIRFEGSGWFTEDCEEITNRFGGRWVTSDFKAGDVLIFTLQTIHMSLTNQTQKARISCDTRWYPAMDSPDHRFVGDLAPLKAKYGDHVRNNGIGVTIDDLKMQWGFK